MTTTRSIKPEDLITEDMALVTDADGFFSIYPLSKSVGTIEITYLKDEGLRWEDVMNDVYAIMGGMSGDVVNMFDTILTDRIHI